MSEVRIDMTDSVERIRKVLEDHRVDDARVGV
jgi:hypothetical protein